MAPAQISPLIGIGIFLFLFLLLFLEAGLILLSATFYFRLLPTFIKIPMDKPIKPEIISGASADLSLHVTHGKLVDNVLWLTVQQGGAWFMIGWKGKPPLPVKWNLDAHRKVIKSIEIKLPLGPILIWLTGLFILWNEAHLLTSSVITILVVLFFWKSWENLQLHNNPDLKSVVEKLVC